MLYRLCLSCFPAGGWVLIHLAWFIPNRALSSAYLYYPSRRQVLAALKAFIELIQASGR
jgi:hypothetical protein